jgi:hypothetical protein
MEPLTRDSEKLICSMYKRYTEKRSAGYSKSDAAFFGNTHDIHENFCPTKTFEDVDEMVWELKRNGYIDGDEGENILFEISITSSCIVYMENRFKNGAKDILSFLSNFIP